MNYPALKEFFVNNGIGDVYDKIKGHPMEEEFKADIMKQYETMPGMAMVNSNTGINNLHIAINDTSISMPNVINDYTTTGHISNVGLLAQKKAEVYGSNGKTFTFEIASEGTVNVTDVAGNKIFEHAVETGDISSHLGLRPRQGGTGHYQLRRIHAQRLPDSLPHPRARHPCRHSARE